MGYLASLLEKRGNFDDTFAAMTVAGSATGVNVTEESSLKSTAVFACVRVLAESVASLPLILYERQADGGKKRANDVPLYSILHDLPNPEMTSVELRETLAGHMALWGNAYAEIERSNGSQVKGLWPLLPNKMTVERSASKVIYIYELPNGQGITLPANRVMHLRSVGADGLIGYSPIALARQAVGLALATEEFGARFFGNGARPGAVLEHPGKLGDKALKNLRETFAEQHQGLSKSHRLAILEEGMKLHEIGIPPEDAQFLETRRFQVSEIARIFRVPPHLIGDLDRATFSNVEQQSLDFVIHTLRPWLVRWEQAIYRDLLSIIERPRYFAEFLVDGLLRGDIASRYQAYAIGRQNGWLSANDVRRLENMNPVEDGDVYLIPLNMIPAGQAGQMQAAEPEPVDTEPEEKSGISYESRARKVSNSRLALANSYQPLFEDVAGRVYRREIADVQRAIKKYLVNQFSPSEFKLWLNQFYSEHADFWQRQLAPLLSSYSEQLARAVADELGGEPGHDLSLFLEQYNQSMAGRETKSSRLQLESLLDESQPETAADALNQRLDEWNDTRAAKFGHDSSRRTNNALAKTLYIASGITLLRWTTTGDNCPYCRALNGQVVGVQDWFLKSGIDFKPAGADKPINVGSHNVGHPPLHNGCDCMVVAG